MMGLKDLFNRLFGGAKKDNGPDKDQTGPKTLDGTPAPGWLKLEFSKAADIGPVNELFEPEIKDHIDPKNFVVKRMDHSFHASIENEGAALLRDENDEIYTMALAYHIHVQDDQTGKQHDYTEIGTTITRLGGYSSAPIVITAQTMKEWWEREPRDMIVAEIDPDNGASTHIFGNKLGWKPIKDKKLNDFIVKLCDDTVHPDHRGGDIQLFYCNDDNIHLQARTMLEYMDRGELVNKDGHSIKIDFSALDDIGLTRDVLEKIADRKFSQIQKPVPVPVPPPKTPPPQQPNI